MDGVQKPNKEREKVMEEEKEDISEMGFEESFCLRLSQSKTYLLFMHFIFIKLNNIIFKRG